MPIPAPRFPSARPLRAIAALCTIVASATACGPARAEVRVEGDVEAVRLEADAATVADVLSALAPFNVSYRTSIPLADRVSMTYAGPVEQAVTRMLTGFNYVLKRDNGAIEIIVLGRHGSRAIAVEAPKPPPAPNTASSWRSKAPPSKP
jgi:hypothetical protein